MSVPVADDPAALAWCTAALALLSALRYRRQQRAYQPTAVYDSMARSEAASAWRKAYTVSATEFEPRVLDAFLSRSAARRPPICFDPSAFAPPVGVRVLYLYCGCSEDLAHALALQSGNGTRRLRRCRRSHCTS